MNYVFRDPEELTSVFDAKNTVIALWTSITSIEGAQLLARIVYRLEQRWFLSMIWDTDELLPVKPELDPFKNSDINPYGNFTGFKYLNASECSGFQPFINNSVVCQLCGSHYSNHFIYRGPWSGFHES